MSPNPHQKFSIVLQSIGFTFFFTGPIAFSRGSDIPHVYTFNYSFVFIFSLFFGGLSVEFLCGQIIKLLKKESISWIEGENPGTILIRLDEIDPKCLSFARK